MNENIFNAKIKLLKKSIDTNKELYRKYIAENNIRMATKTDDYIRGLEDAYQLLKER